MGGFFINLCETQDYSPPVSGKEQGLWSLVANMSLWLKEMVSTQTTTGPVRSVMNRSKVHMSNMQQQTPQQPPQTTTTHNTDTHNKAQLHHAGLFPNGSFALWLFQHLVRNESSQDWQIDSSLLIPRVVVHGTALSYGRAPPRVEPAAYFDSTRMVPWPFSVGGVMCHVNSVSLCTEKRGERRRKMRKRERERKERRIKRRDKDENEER